MSAPGRSQSARALAWLNRAQFVRSVVQWENLPAESVAEVCFVGRSNAGKSSAINTIVNHNRLAFVSKAPGRTRELNYFTLGQERYLVDLPGYGYASAGRTLRQSWDKLIGRYLLERVQLKAVVLIMDIRHAPTELDVQLIDFLRPPGRPVIALLTKADKFARGARLQAARAIATQLGGQGVSSVQAFSSLTGDGADEARIKLCEALELPLLALETEESPKIKSPRQRGVKPGAKP